MLIIISILWKCKMMLSIIPFKRYENKNPKGCLAWEIYFFYNFELYHEYEIFETEIRWGNKTDNLFIISWVYLIGSSQFIVVLIIPAADLCTWRQNTENCSFESRSDWYIHRWKQSGTSVWTGRSYTHDTSIAAWIKNHFRRTSEHNYSYNYLNFSFFHQK